MAGHNSPYSKGVIKGVLTDMVECVREIAYEGNYNLTTQKHLQWIFEDFWPL